MLRFVLTGSGGLLGGVFVWMVVGYLAAPYLAKLGGSKESAESVALFLLIGGIAGLWGLIGSGWLVWRMSADKARRSAIGLTLSAVALALAGGWIYAFHPLL